MFQVFRNVTDHSAQPEHKRLIEVQSRDAVKVWLQLINNRLVKTV